MNLNVGSGDLAVALPALAQNWLYFDLNGWPCHVRGDALALPFREDAFDAVHCSHLIEHVSLTNALHLARELRRVLSPSGYAYVSAPDAGRTRDIRSPYWCFLTKRGGPTRGWAHHWSPTVKSLRALLLEAGLVPTWATGVPQGHPPNTHAWPVDLESRFVCRRDDFPWPQRFPLSVGNIR